MGNIVPLGRDFQKEAKRGFGASEVDFRKEGRILVDAAS
jgi:hypothetical protein